MKLAARLICALLMAALFAAVVIALIAGFFFLMEQAFGHRMAPRGAGWALAIISALIAGLRVGYSVPDNTDLAFLFWESLIESQIGRAVLVGAASWVAVWITYSWFFLKKGRRCYYDCGWNSETWSTFFGVLFGAPMSIIGVYLVVKWIRAGK